MDNDEIEHLVSELVQRELTKGGHGRSGTSDDTPASVNFVQNSEFVGSTLAFFKSNYTHLNKTSWVVDTGASGHMCSNLQLVNGFYKPNSNIVVGLPDGRV